MKKIFIIIPVHNRREITLACLQNLMGNKDIEKYHILIVDDGSTDGTNETITTQYPTVIILKGDGNLWWTGAIKLGMEYAYNQGADYIIWLNDDCQVPENIIDKFLHFVIAYPNSIIGGQGISRDHPAEIVFGGKRKTWQGYRFIQAAPKTIISCDLLSGNLVCIPRSLIDTIGYPNPQITPHYGGDSLYLIRAKKAGYALYVDARYIINDVHSISPLYPRNWLLGEGEPLQLLKLALNPYSGLSWRVWFILNWEAYQWWGIIMFFKKYISLLIISILRFIPLRLRKKIFLFYN